ncbi:retinal pigment epithelial membrane family protein [Mycobacterium xenopi 3993]|nr:retinal pigment epithelial membrane family protein [Mycobacterium xenopi 3993]
MIDVQGRVRRTVDIDVGGSPAMHDFSLTDNYVVVYDLPVTFDPVQVLPVKVPRWLGLPARLVLQSLIGGSDAQPDHGADQPQPQAQRPLPIRVESQVSSSHRVMPRDGDNADVRWFDIEPCYVFHPLNATRKSVTAPRSSSSTSCAMTGCSSVTCAARRQPPTLDRWTVNLASGSVTTERRDDRSQEFPRINENLTGSRHRFGYTVGLDDGYLSAGVAAMRTALYKHDFQTGFTAVANLDQDLLLGEMCFVPAPSGGHAEDNGILMGYGYHRGRDEGQLLLLDAQTCEPVATVHLPQRVPMGFHGNWAPNT